MLSTVGTVNRIKKFRAKAIVEFAKTQDAKTAKEMYNEKRIHGSI